jgi:HAD superfamily hydrolase (TIGR01549 family)
MAPIISFDMDGTLVESGYTDWVWNQGIPELYAAKAGFSFEDAKAFVEGEYRKVGEAAVEWYDIQYWFRFFQLEQSWRSLMEHYLDKINVYPDVHHLLGRLSGKFRMVLTSNAGREFIDVEMGATGLARYFEQIFSATSDFREVKKTPHFYRRVCEMLKVSPGDLVHIGDHYEFDYLVPRAVGIQAFYLDRSGRREGEFVLQDLKGLEKRLHHNQG